VEVIIISMKLAHGEAHPLAADDMDMQVKDGLPTIDAAIKNQTVAVLVDAILLGDLASHNENVTGESFVSGSQLVQRVDVPVGDYENMGGRHRVDIPESGHLVVLVDDLSRR
jgi:hypothetical protein